MTPVPTPPQIGTLDWRPATEHPELLAAPVAASLSSLGIDAYVAPIDPDLADTAAFCAAYAVPLEVSANCVVVAGRRAVNSIMAGCLVLATDRADVNRTVRKHLDVRKISFADMADAVTRTGMEYGGITPGGPARRLADSGRRGRRRAGLDHDRQRHPRKLARISSSPVRRPAGCPVRRCSRWPSAP